MPRIHLLGRLRLIDGHLPWPLAGPPRVARLLAYLLVIRADPGSRDRLAFTFWPDASETQARANLR